MGMSKQEKGNVLTNILIGSLPERTKWAIARRKFNFPKTREEYLEIYDSRGDDKRWSEYQHNRFRAGEYVTKATGTSSLFNFLLGAGAFYYLLSNGGDVLGDPTYDKYYGLSSLYLLIESIVRGWTVHDMEGNPGSLFTYPVVLPFEILNGIYKAGKFGVNKLRKKINSIQEP